MTATQMNDRITFLSILVTIMIDVPSQCIRIHTQITVSYSVKHLDQHLQQYFSAIWRILFPAFGELLFGNLVLVSTIEYTFGYAYI